VSHIHFVGGEKGGVGKSVVARLLAQYFIDRGTPVAGIDADTSHPALVRYYRDYTQSVDLSRFESADQIMDRALGAERQVVVDLPANSARFLADWMKLGDVLQFAEESDVGITFWHVTDGGYDSVEQLGRLLDAHGPYARMIVVRNQARAASFAQFDGSPERQRLLDRGGRIVDLPPLHEGTMYRIDRTGSSFWAAMNDTESELALPPMDRRRARHWYARVVEMLEPVLAPVDASAGAASPVARA